MGVVSDFMVVDLDDAQRACDASLNDRDFPWSDGGVDQPMLAPLYSLLTGKRAAPDFMHEYVCCTSDDGPWLFEFPREMVRRLAALDARDIPAAAKEWAGDEAFAEIEEVPLDAVEQVLTDLSSLAQIAVEERQSLVLWLST
ncbi:MAG TPA: hypothetical protein VGE52_10255 [Pirellulales bacterium]